MPRDTNFGIRNTVLSKLFDESLSINVLKNNCDFTYQLNKSKKGIKMTFFIKLQDLIIRANETFYIS